MNLKYGSVDDFIFDIKEKRYIYCFGAGVALTDFFSTFCAYNIEYHVKAIADNSVEKQGTIIQCNGKDIPIISPENMINEIISKDVILITTVKYIEIIKQLRNFEELRNIDCYLCVFLAKEQFDYDRLKIDIPESLSIYQEQRIPKTIHYCWFGEKKLPDQYRLWMESWKRYCPDYEVIEWNEKNYDVRKNKYVCQAYEMGDWAFVSDYARLDIVYEHGGIYLDTDVELIKNIDEMLMNDAFCGFENDQYVAYGLGFGAKKGHSLVGEIKEYYDNASFIFEDGTTDKTPCPVIQTQIMKRHGLKCDGKFQIVSGMTVYPSRVLCGMSPYSFRLERNTKAYAIHHYTSSWREDDHLQRRKNLMLLLKKYSNNQYYYYPDL